MKIQCIYLTYDATVETPARPTGVVQLNNSWIDIQTTLLQIEFRSEWFKSRLTMPQGNLPQVGGPRESPLFPDYPQKGRQAFCGFRGQVARCHPRFPLSSQVWPLICRVEESREYGSTWINSWITSCTETWWGQGSKIFPCDDPRTPTFIIWPDCVSKIDLFTSTGELSPCLLATWWSDSECDMSGDWDTCSIIEIVRSRKVPMYAK